MYNDPKSFLATDTDLAANHLPDWKADCSCGICSYNWSNSLDILGRESDGPSEFKKAKKLDYLNLLRC